MRADSTCTRRSREASVCANIDSDHVVNVIDTDVDADSGMPFLVMELLNGKDLSQYISETWGRGAPIPLSTVLTVLRQVASALDKVAAEKVQALAAGATDDIHGTMIAVKEAEISVKLVGSIRNKLLDAFHELWRTNV